MSCLHLVSLSHAKPNTLAQLDAVLSDADAILLLGAGMALAPHFANRDLPVYLWDDKLSDAEVVSLTLQHDKSMSWHD